MKESNNEMKSKVESYMEKLKEVQHLNSSLLFPYISHSLHKTYISYVLVQDHG